MSKIKRVPIRAEKTRHGVNISPEKMVVFDFFNQQYGSGMSFQLDEAVNDYYEKKRKEMENLHGFKFNDHGATR